LLQLQRYPEAKLHFQNALDSGRTPSEKKYEYFNLADVCWRLGDYAETKQHLAQLPVDVQVRIIQADVLLSQNQYSAALSALPRPTDVTSRFVQAQAQLIAASAELHLGRLDSAHRRIEEVEAQAVLDKDQDSLTRIRPLRAELALAQKSPSTSRDLARQASEYFQSSGQQESEFVSLYSLMLSQNQLADRDNSARTARQALDIMQGWEQSWNPPQFQSYIHRPDIAAILRELRDAAQLRHEGVK